MEIWKAIKGYEGRYEVSNHGNVKALKRLEFMPWVNRNRLWAEKMIRPQKKNNLYLFVILSDGGGRSTQKCKYIHRLVAEAFKGPISHGHVVNHLDSDVSNNNESNLEIISQRDNCIYGLGRRKKSSIYPGVHRETKTGYWKAMVRQGKKKLYLGKFDNEAMAYKAYVDFLGKERLTHLIK